MEKNSDVAAICEPERDALQEIHQNPGSELLASRIGRTNAVT